MCPEYQRETTEVSSSTQHIYLKQQNIGASITNFTSCFSFQVCTELRTVSSFPGSSNVVSACHPAKNLLKQYLLKMTAVMARLLGIILLQFLPTKKDLINISAGKKICNVLLASQKTRAKHNIHLISNQDNCLHVSV